jgi:hypothetical protein
VRPQAERYLATPQCLLDDVWQFIWSPAIDAHLKMELESRYEMQ